MKVGVMHGDLREFDLGQVLQVAGLGRQYLEIELHDGGTLAGTISVKGGKIVRVEGREGQGAEAFFQLFRRNEGQFQVFRMETPEVLPEPLGSVNAMLAEAVENLKQLDPSSPRLTTSLPDFTQPPFAIHAEIAPPPSLTQGAPAALDHTALGAPPVPLDAADFSAPQATPVVEPPASPAPAVPPPAPSPVRAASSAPPPPPPRLSTPGAARSVRPPRDASIPADPAPPRHIRSLTQARMLAVASPKGGCGKTTIALNLSLSLARQGRSVILVDADINGDVLSSINARQRAEIGVYDVLLGVAGADEALLDTVLPHFKIMPAVGGQLPRADAISADHSASWRALALELGKHAEIVLIDTPAGVFGATAQILQACTHVLGVLQAESVANRSFSRFVEALRTLPDERRPEVIGIVVNMLQTRVAGSLSVFQNAVTELPAEWLFETTIPRHRAFLDATHAGLPLRHLDEVAPPAVAWLFDNLAAEVAERLRLAPVEKRPQPLLL